MAAISKKPLNRSFSSVSQDEKYKLSAVGCLIDFLRANGHAPIESLIDYVSSKRDLLLTAKGEKFTKSAFEIVDYALSWYPKIFLLDKRFYYFLDEEEAAKHENDFKNKNERKLKSNALSAIRRRKILEMKWERRIAMRRIKHTIETDLKKSFEEYSPITKAYLILISDDTEAISRLKRCAREAYIEIIRPNDL